LRLSLLQALANLRAVLLGKSAPVAPTIDVAVLGRLRHELLAESNWIDAKTDLPTDADFALMGKFIQLYCYAEFNARRLADALSTKIRGLKSIKYYRLNDPDLLVHLRKIVDRDIWKPGVRSNVLTAIDILEMHRTHRHSFAHWVVRKHTEADVYVILSMNAGEAEKRDPGPHSDGTAKFGLMPVEILKVELKKISEHGDYLAKLVAAIEAETFDPIQSE
jgi:hypothetical protein